MPGEGPQASGDPTRPTLSCFSPVSVGVPGFEPGTSCPPDKRANQAAPHPEVFTLAKSEQSRDLQTVQDARIVYERAVK